MADGLRSTGAAASWRCSIAGGRGAPRIGRWFGGRANTTRVLHSAADFLEFVASEYPAGEDAESLAVTTLLEYETQFERPYQRGTAPPASPPTPEGAPPVADLEAVPRVANRRDPPAPPARTMRA